MEYGLQNCNQFQNDIRKNGVNNLEIPDILVGVIVTILVFLGIAAVLAFKKKNK